MKYFMSLMLFFSLVFASENKVVKTSELELFLFKIGFESLLKDVEITKGKSELNEEGLKKLNKKIEYIMSQMKQNKILVQEDTSDKSSISSDEIQALKVQIQNLQKQVNLLKNQEVTHSSYNFKKKNSKRIAFVNIGSVSAREKPMLSSKKVKEIKRSESLEIDYCDRFQWCKVKGEKLYIPKYLLKFL